MRVPLSPHAFRLVDGASKVVGLVAVAAALNGAAAPHSPLVGVLGVAVGVSTVFLSPRESGADGDRTPGTLGGSDSARERGRRPLTRAARRLWRSRLTRIGAACWLVAFLVAGAGVVLGAVGVHGPTATLFAVSGPLGLLGTLAIAAAGVREAASSLRA